MRVSSRAVAGALVLVAASAVTAGAQRPEFGPTLFWDSGLINAPAAWVSPLGGDLAFAFSRLQLDSARLPHAAGRHTNNNLSLSASLWGRGEAGISVCSGDLLCGLFGKLVVWDQTDGIWRAGIMHWLPSVAVGARNIGTVKDLNRLAVTGDSGLNTAPSWYGVLTRTIELAHADQPGERPKAQLSVVAGYGTGLFSDDGGLGKRYASSSTHGVFGGAQVSWATGRYSTLSLLLEQDGWGMNAGARFEWRGVLASASLMEIGASDAGSTASSYASQKVAFAIGWRTNVQSLLRGNRLEQRTAAMDQERERQQRELEQRQQSVAALEGQLEALTAVETRERAAERVALEARLREEQEALRRLQELLKQKEAAKKP